MRELRRYQKGSVSRRHFLGVTGLGMATLVLGSAMPGLKPRRALAAGDLGDTLAFTTWPNYFAQENFDSFTEETGVNINVSVFGSNEEMLAKLQAGGTGWDVFVPTNYTISTYHELDLIEPLDLARLPAFDPSTHDARFIDAGQIDGVLYAVPKDWGTTGYVVNTDKVDGEMTTWKDFWDRARGDLTGRVMVHDYQLTTIGNALKYFGYSFNSVDPGELADAEKLLIECKPHLFAINSDYQPSMRNGDAWASVCWTGDGKQLNRDIPAMQYVLGREGGEIWTDFYAIPKDAPHIDAAYAFIDYMLTPAVNAKEVLAHGYPSTDAATNALLPKEILEDPILYPAAELLANLEFGAAATLTDPLRAEIMNRFKSA
jgi:spermidine/putrescine transport system substrate-binding protein